MKMKLALSSPTVLAIAAYLGAKRRGIADRQYRSSHYCNGRHDAALLQL
jgi:hypothetical protein